ncbi:MAG: YraN family protein [Clostridia bacterium]|nr:YraN family protein [Clostridia bacterium]
MEINNKTTADNILKSTKQENRIKGDIGENKAVKYLTDKGYEILETNYKNKLGEIDIIAKDDTRIVFVEVKARATAKYGYPREAVNEYKQRKIRMVAESYLKSKRLLNSYIRFDVIEILAGNITHLIAAF